MTPSSEFLIICCLIAVVWLSLRHDIRALTRELRQINGDPMLRDRDIEFNEALAKVSRVMQEPVNPRDLLEQRQ